MTVALFAAWLPLAGNALAAGSANAANPDTPGSAMSGDDLKAASERIRQTGTNIQSDIREALRRARAQRAVLEAQQAAERKREAERARRQAARDAALMAAAKQAKERQALEAAQAQARKEAEMRQAKVERERQLALQAQRALEEKLAREQQAAARGGRPKLGGETKFGVDI
jgi:hypothetical protein